MSSDAHATTDEHRQGLAQPPATLRTHEVTLRGPRLLLDFGFHREAVDVIYACVDAGNRRSRRMFASLGFASAAGSNPAPGSSADADLDMMLTRSNFEATG